MSSCTIGPDLWKNMLISSKDQKQDKKEKEYNVFKIHRKMN